MISSTNTGLSPRPHPRKSCSFVLSWSAGASATRTLKAQDTKRTFKTNFPNFPAVKPKAKCFEPRQIWYQNAPNIRAWREIAFSLVSLIVRKRSNFFVNKPEIGIIPTRKADPNIFLIAPKQDYNDAQHVKLPYSTWLFFHFLRFTAQTKAKCSKT